MLQCILLVQWIGRGMAGYGPACVKTQKRPPEFDREFEGLPGKAGSLLMRLLLAQGPPVISQAMFWARSLPLEA